MRQVLPDLWTLRELLEQFRGIILDIFGVLHDGVSLYPNVHETLCRLRDVGVRICLLSNSPRRARAVVSRLSDMGIGPDLYQGLLTSGEMAFSAISSTEDSRTQPSRYLHLGPRELEDLLDGLPLRSVATWDEADFVLATGYVDLTDDILEAMIQRNLPMICANPDIEVMIAGKRVPCAGRLAANYSAIGGKVVRFGKPEHPAYDRALRILDLAAGEVVAIGDSIATDIAGANRAGIKSALVLTGIHQSEIAGADFPDVQAIARLCSRHDAVPDALLQRFSWI